MENKWAIVIIVIAVILIIAILALKGGNNNSENPVVNSIENTVGLVEEFADVLSDGTKLNNSEKLVKTKKIGELELSNFQLTEKNSQTVLLGTIKNPTATVQGGYPATVIILDKEGNTVVELAAYINQVKPGEEQQLNVSATLNYANAYDFKIVKK